MGPLLVVILSKASINTKVLSKVRKYHFYFFITPRYVVFTFEGTFEGTFEVRYFQSIFITFESTFRHLLFKPCLLRSFIVPS